MSDPHATLALHRRRNLLAERPDLREHLEQEREVVQLAPDQILHAAAPATYLVRLGKLRVSEFLDDGRELTRAVLQAGAVLDTDTDRRTTDPAADIYVLRDCVLMALGETELWLLPAGRLV
jgi:CRP-like cAMP-binding protein